jgi:hypothetical protein
LGWSKACAPEAHAKTAKSRTTSCAPYLRRIEGPARHDPQRLVRGKKLLVEFVAGREGGVVQHKLHDLEQVVLEHIRVRLADQWKLDVVDRLGLI